MLSTRRSIVKPIPTRSDWCHRCGYLDLCAEIAGKALCRACITDVAEELGLEVRVATGEMFAADFPRNEKGWVLFPTRDSDLRRKYFPEEVFTHPAKANIYLIQALYRHYSKPGDSILDPFGGTGTIMLAGVEGRRLILMEVEPYYADMIRDGARKMFPGVDLELTWGEQMWERGPVRLISGDNRQNFDLIPAESVDCCITSPPYANTLSHSTAIVEEKEKLEKYNLGKASGLNLGRLNHFLFEQQMKRVYEGIHKVLKPGAPCIMIVKDIMKGGVRQFLSDGVIRQCGQAGLAYEGEWHKWKPQGSMQQNIMRSKGFDVVDDEDLIVFRRR